MDQKSQSAKEVRMVSLKGPDGMSICVAAEKQPDGTWKIREPGMKDLPLAASRPTDPPHGAPPSRG